MSYQTYITLLNELLKETISLNNEIKRIRNRLDSKNFQVGKKFNIINNELLILKPKTGGITKSYIANIEREKKQTTISFD